MTQETLTIAIVSERLKDFVSPEYAWPELPTGWQLKFIVFPDGEVNMDFLHPVSCAFWSEDNGFLQTPFGRMKEPITRSVLDKCAVPYMTTFGHAAVNTKPKESHLKSI